MEKAGEKANMLAQWPAFVCKVKLSSLAKVTRRPRFPGTVPVLSDLSPVKAVPENAPDFDTEWGECAQTQTPVITVAI